MELLKLEMKSEPYDDYVYGEFHQRVVKEEWGAMAAALLLAGANLVPPDGGLDDLGVKDEKKVNGQRGVVGTSEDSADSSIDDGDEKVPRRNLRKRLTNKEIKDRPYKCENCPYKSFTVAGLKRHTKIHEDGKNDAPHKCDKCEFRTKYKCSLEYHEKTHTSKEKKVFSCKMCNYQGLQSKAFSKHLLTHELPSQVYKCDRPGCSYQTNQKKHLRSHAQTHRDPETMIWYKCDQCPFKYVNERNLRFHQLKHKDPLEGEWFHCTECPYRTRDKNCLRKHSVKHVSDSEARWYQCEYDCDFRTKRKSALRKHVVSFHDRDRQIYRCASCPFATAHKESLVPHMLLHSDPDAGPWYQCNQCNYRARLKNYVNRHAKKAHKAVGFKTEDGAIEFFEDTKLYICNYCTFETVHKTSYKDHLLLHKDPNEVEWFSCPQCDYKSLYKSNLMSHMNRHKDPGERPWFKCPQCKYKANFKSCLTRHISLKHKR